MSYWDHLSLYADSNDEFNSHSEDVQDLVPDNTDLILESQSESLRRTWDLLTLLKKFLNFFWPTCFLENLRVVRRKQADDIPHSASRTASPASLRDHLSLFADNDGDFYSQSEDNQDLSPDTETYGGHGISEFIKEVFRLLRAVMFPRKTEEFWEGTGQDLPLSWEIRKTTKRAFLCLS